MQKILQHVAEAVRHRLIRREGTFGFYGVDFLLDQQLNCWLLEMNSGPTLDMTNRALEEVIPRCLQAALRGEQKGIFSHALHFSFYFQISSRPCSINVGQLDLHFR